MGEGQTTETQAAPTVTVVIPVFNGENYLGEAITSVLNQTYRDFEIVVVDDGSQDNTWAVIEQFAAAHPAHVRGIRKENGGVSSALNAGIVGARGKYVAWLSHDDRFVPRKLELQMELLGYAPELVGVYSDYSYINSEGRTIGRVYAAWYPQPEMVRNLLHTVFLNGSTLVIERQCLLQVGLFDEKLRYAADALMWADLLIRYPIAHIPEALTEYRVHPQQASTRIKRQIISQDNQAWLRRVVEGYPIQQLFPELDKPDVKASDLAEAYLYIGDVFVLRHWHYKLGMSQYWKAFRAWPSWRNPVFRRTAEGFLRARVQEYRVTRRKTPIASPGVSSDNQQSIVDMRPGNEVVKCVRFTPEY